MRVKFSWLNYLQHLTLPSNSPFSGMFASSSLYNCLKKQESMPKHVHHYPAVVFRSKMYEELKAHKTSPLMLNPTMCHT